MSSEFSSTRLYIGNLSTSVDEYSLIQVCSKHGKISKLDYLFHKIGPAKGKPRGYAFVEYETKEEALRAMAALNDKLVRGRKIVVTAAAEQSNNLDDVRLAALSGHGRAKGRADASRPTAISLLKGQGVAGASTNRKIAALEAKLAALRKSKPVATFPPSDHPIASTSALSAEDDGAGERWLDSLLPGEGAAAGEGGEEVDRGGMEQGEGGSGSSAGAKEVQPVQEESLRRIVVDAKKAGLPDRPWFDAAPPSRAE